MKTKITLFLLLIFSIYHSQISPSYVTYLSDQSIQSSYLDKSSNSLYFCYAENGEIKKLDLNNPTTLQTTVLSGLLLPAKITVIGTKLYFIEIGIEDGDSVIPNTGKLSYIDLSLANPSIITILSSLNAPIELAGGSDFLIIDENTIVDPDFGFDQQFISKINLSGAITKTPIVTRKWGAAISTEQRFDNFEVIGNNLYSNSYTTADVGYFYKTPLDTKISSVTHSFSQRSPYNFAIYQNNFYYSDGRGPGSTYKTPLNNQEITAISTDYMYNNQNTGFDQWNFDANGNGYVFLEEGANLHLAKYTAQQLLRSQEIVDSNTNLKIFPNPVSDLLNFSQPLNHIKIYDFAGKLVQKNISTSKYIDVKSILSGNYLLEATDDKGALVSKKFIKK